MQLENPDGTTREQLDRRIELLAGVATDTLRYSQPDQLLLSAWDRISAETRTDLCLCYAVENERLRLSFSVGLKDGFQPQIESLDLGQDVCGIAARDRRPLPTSLPSR